MKNDQQVFKSIEEAIKDGNSIVNQNIKSKFIQREVYGNVGMMVEYILKASYEVKDAPFELEDIENLYSYDEIEYQRDGKTCSFSGTEEEKDALIEELKEEDEEANAEAIETLENAEADCSEVFEWWLVSSFLLAKLKEKGHPVIQGFNSIWGRCTTGQAILLDSVITHICAEMSILDGQSNSWATMK